MGKRELLLLTVFAAIGVLVYRVTMPASSEGGGFGAWLTRIRNQVHNEWVERRVEKEAEAKVGPDIRTLSLEIERGSISIIGEARETAAANVAVVVFGGDDAAAQKLTEQITLSLVPEGGVLKLALVLPKREENGRRPHLQVTLRVPARLAVDVRSGGGELDVTGVAEVHASKAVGRVHFTNIAGAVTGELGPGEIEIDQAGSVKVSSRRSDVRVRTVKGAFELEARGGDVRVRGIEGPATLDAQGIDAELEDIGGPVKISGTGGQVRVRGARGSIDADTRRTELFLMPALPVTITASTEADSIDLTLPPGGVFLDAAASPGDIRLPEGLLKVEREDDDAKASGALRGGGPKVTLRTSRGDIVIR